MATESGRASSPPNVASWGRAEWEGRRGGCLGSMAASRCWRRASSWARAFCFLLILLVDGLRLLLLLRISDEVFPLLRRRKLKLERRGPTCGSPVDWECAIEGRTEGSGEPSFCNDVLRGLGAVLAIVGGCEALIMNGWHLARVILAMKGAAQTTLLLGVPKRVKLEDVCRLCCSQHSPCSNNAPCGRRSRVSLVDSLTSRPEANAGTGTQVAPPGF
jgi:hypothetical protein